MKLAALGVRPEGALGVQARPEATLEATRG
jgi:hypothetical protein